MKSLATVDLIPVLNQKRRIEGEEAEGARRIQEQVVGVDLLAHAMEGSIGLQACAELLGSPDCCKCVVGGVGVVLGDCTERVISSIRLMEVTRDSHVEIGILIGDVSEKNIAGWTGKRRGRKISYISLSSVCEIVGASQ